MKKRRRERRECSGPAIRSTERRGREGDHPEGLEERAAYIWRPESTEPEHAGISRNRATRNRKSEMWLCDTCSEAQSVPAHLAEAAGVITASEAVRTSGAVVYLLPGCLWPQLAIPSGPQAMAARMSGLRGGRGVSGRVGARATEMKW